MRRKHIGFEQLSDIVAFRVIVGTVEECYQALGIIHGHYRVVPGRFKDYVSIPKPNEYRSLHTTVIGPENQRIEMQIRTREMHQVAELGVAAQWQFKQGEQTDGRQYRGLRELLEILEHAEAPEEFLENTKLEMFTDQVFCFSPKGEVIKLPRGATPIDFAYAIHTNIGNHCAGAKVDGRRVPLWTPLKNGQQVDIMHAERPDPVTTPGRHREDGAGQGPDPPQVERKDAGGTDRAGPGAGRAGLPAQRQGSRRQDVLGGGEQAWLCNSGRHAGRSCGRTGDQRADHRGSLSLATD